MTTKQGAGERICNAMSTYRVFLPLPPAYQTLLDCVYFCAIGVLHVASAVSCEFDRFDPCMYLVL